MSHNFFLLGSILEIITRQLRIEVGVILSNYFKTVRLNLEKEASQILSGQKVQEFWIHQCSTKKKKQLKSTQPPRPNKLPNLDQSTFGNKKNYFWMSHKKKQLSILNTCLQKQIYLFGSKLHTDAAHMLVIPK